MGGVRQRAARRQPGPHLVDHGHHEDRPRRPRPARPRHGLQRGRRLRRRRRHRPRHRLHRRAARAAPRTVLPRPRLRRRSDSASPRCSSARPAATPATRPPTTSPPTTPSTTQPDHRRDLHPHLLPREGAVVVLAGRAGQQPQRRPRLGAVPHLLRRRRPLRRPHRRPRRPLPGRVGTRAARHRRPVGPDRPQAADRRRHAHPSRRHRLDRRHHRLRRLGARRRRCSAPAPPWSTPPCSPPIGDVAHPAWRARSVGVYRLWRDAGFAVGALLAGILADLVSHRPPPSGPSPPSPPLSGLVVAVRMYETHRPTT